MSTSLTRSRPSAQPRTGMPLESRTHLGRRFVGGFYLSMGGVHLGIVAADPQFYRPFADQAVLSLVRTGWAEIFMANPVLWGLLLAAGETLLGVALLAGATWAKIGWIGVILFHLLLVLFGWGFLYWSVPALTLLLPLAVRNWKHLH